MDDYQRVAKLPLPADLQQALSQRQMPEQSRKFAGFILRWKAANKLNPPQLWPTGGTAIRPNESAQLMLAAFNSARPADQQLPDQALVEGLHDAANLEMSAMAIARRQRLAVQGKRQPAALRR